MDDHERGCWAAVNRVPGVGPARVRRLLSRFGTLAGAWSAPAADLAGAGIDRRVVEALLALRARTSPAAELEQAQRAGARVLTWLDEDYPPRLATIPDPPPVLYVRGTLLAQDERAVAVVGTRRPTYYGRERRRAPRRGLRRRRRLRGQRPGPGDRHPRPPRGPRRRGAHPGRPGARPGHRLPPGEPAPGGADRRAPGPCSPSTLPGRAPRRRTSRPATGSSPAWRAGVLVVEAGAQSGALITCRYAADQGRDVFAVPGPVTSPASDGCHRLIQDGAKLVREAADVLDELVPTVAGSRPGGARRALRRGRWPLDLDEPAGALLRAILDRRRAGRRRLPGPGPGPPGAGGDGGPGPAGAGGAGAPRGRDALRPDHLLIAADRF